MTCSVVVFLKECNKNRSLTVVQFKKIMLGGHRFNHVWEDEVLLCMGVV